MGHRRVEKTGTEGGPRRAWRGQTRVTQVEESERLSPDLRQQGRELKGHYRDRMTEW